MKQTHIIATFNQKGGVGKTTTAINVAAYLAKKNQTVLLVDSDPQANTTSGLGIITSGTDLTLCDVLLNRSSALQTVRKTNIKNLYIMPTDARLSSIEVDLAQAENREQRLRDAFNSLKGDYDYIIVDCPPALGLLTINALTASNTVLIPVQAEYYALEGLSQLLQVMQRVKMSFNPELELLGVLLTMYDKRTSLAEQVYSEVKKHFGDKIFNTVIPRNVRLAEAPSYSQPISEYDKWSKGARAYKKLAGEIEERIHGK